MLSGVIEIEEGLALHAFCRAHPLSVSKIQIPVQGMFSYIFNTQSLALSDFYPI